MSLTVWARDANRMRRGIMPTLPGSKVIKRGNAPHTWNLILNAKDPIVQQFTEGCGVIVFEDDELIFSGTANTITVNMNGSTVRKEISGESDMSILTRRIVIPNPAQPIDAQTVTHWDRKGVSEALIVDLINAQAGANAPADFKAPGLALAVSQGRGIQTSVQARLTSLQETVQTLARLGGLVVDIQQAQNSTELEVVITQRQDRSRTVRFNTQNGLKNLTSTIKAPTATQVIVGGQGEGVSRELTYTADIDPKWTNLKTVVFKDRRDTDDPDELTKSTNEILETGKATAIADFEISEVPHLRFGQHYEIGDIVTVEIDEHTQITDVIRSAEITWNGHNRTVQLAVGENEARESKAPEWMKKNRDIQNRLSRLEASL